MAMTLDAELTTNSKLVVARFIDAMGSEENRAAVLGRYVSAANLRDKIARFEADYPGFRIVPTDIFAEGDMVVVQFFTALPEGSGMVPGPAGSDTAAPAADATGTTLQGSDRRAKPRQPTMEGIAMCRVQEGRISEAWVHSDVMSQVIEVINGAAGVDAAAAREAARTASEHRAGAADPTANRLLIESYLDALSGKDKTAAMVERYATDPTLAEHVLAFEVGFPRYSLVADTVVAEKDKVAVRFHTRQVHAGEFMGVPATGAEVSIPGLIVYRIEAGKIAEHWLHADTWSLMEQLGAVGLTAAD